MPESTADPGPFTRRTARWDTAQAARSPVATPAVQRGFTRLAGLAAFAAVTALIDPALAAPPALPDHPARAGASAEKTDSPKELSRSEELLVPGEDWRLAGSGFSHLTGLATNAQGDLFFNDLHGSKTYALFAQAEPIDPESFVEESGRAEGQAFGPDGRLYAAAAGERKIVAYTRDEAMDIVAEGISGCDLVVRRDGRMFVTEPGPSGTRTGKIWLLHPPNDPRVVAADLKACSGLALSPDESVLYVADAADRTVDAWTVTPQGDLAGHRQFASLRGEGPDEGGEGDKGLGERSRGGGIGITVSRDGRVFVPSAAGIHVFESSGKPAGILPTPDSHSTDLAFAGAQYDTLYIAAGGKLFKRTLRVRGLKPPGPGTVSGTGSGR